LQLTPTQKVMKKHLLLFFLIASNFLSAQIFTNIPDANFEQALIDLGYDTILDGRVLTGLINFRTDLDVSNKNISDLTGIQNFLSLRNLNASFNDLTSVDISNNGQLETVRFDNNNLTSVTIGNHPNLYQLELFENNIASVDVSGLPALEVLYLRANNLSSVDVSNNPLLEVISLQNNNAAMTSLDFSNNPNLKDLLFSDNNVSTLDISNCTDLRWLWCSNNNLTTLDLSHTPLLRDLQCENNQLTYLDVKNGGNTLMNSNFSFRSSGNPDLTCIKVDNATYSANTWTTYVDNFSVFSEHCYETYVPDDNFENYLETHDSIGGNVPVGSISSLGNGIANDNYVETSRISGILSLLIFSRNIQDLTGIEDFTALQTLYAMSNPITTVDLSQNTNLIDLRIRDTNISSLDTSIFPDLAFLSIENTTISTLDISSNSPMRYLWISNTGITSLDVSQNPNLEILHVDQTGITTLDLSNNGSLTRFDGQNSSLSFLNMQNGNNTNVTEFNTTQTPNLLCIDVDDAAYATTNWTQIDAANSFSEHCYETYVPDDNFEEYLEANNLGNGIDDDNYVTTANISGLIFLNLASQNVADMTGIEDFTALETLFVLGNTSLATIDVSNNTNLKDFRLGSTAITNLDVSMLTALETLDASSTSITSIDVTQNSALKTMWLSNTMITSLDVSNNTALEFLHVGDTNIPSLDLSNNGNLTQLFAQNTGLLDLDMKNGNNTNVTIFNTLGATSLTCINVDDANYSTTNWTQIDAANSFSEHCYDTYIPDDNFEQGLIDLGYDSVLDDYVRTENINSLTSLTLINEGIVDFTGLEAFVGLTSLNIRNNNNTTLDVTALVNLISLQCYSNPSMTSINLTGLTNLEFLRVNNTGLTSLDLSTNTALEDLWAFNLADMASNIDVSNNVALDFLHIQNANQSGFLDISYLSNLRSLYLAKNDFTALNVKTGNNVNMNVFDTYENPNLTCINVDDEAYAIANFTNIDPASSFSEHCFETYIPDDNFENYLETHDANGNVVALGAITSMGNGIANDDYVLTSRIETVINLAVEDVSISSLQGIEAFVALTDLNCAGNSLTTLDLSSNLLLESVNASVNNITTLQLPNTITLTSLKLHFNEFSSLDVSQYPALTNLEVNNNSFLTSLNVKNGNNTNFTLFRSTNTPNLSCIIVDDSTYATTNWIFTDMANTFNDVSCDYTSIAIKVYLQGAMLDSPDGLMREDLNTANMIPTTSPYSDALTTVSAAFNFPGGDTTVDWIWLELRDATNTMTVVSSQSALLQRDGDVVQTDGETDIEFNVDYGEYYLVIKHRNHLGIMSANTITLNGSLVNVDFTDATNIITYGTEAQTSFGMPTDVVAMWSGNANGDTIVQYSGTSPDTPNILSLILNDVGNFLNFPTYVVNDYNDNDVNLDGNIQYSGTNPDTPFILQNVLAYPGNFLNFSTYQISEQLPENQ
jgi:Leucine-rich repeat (LRR) protein